MSRRFFVKIPFDVHNPHMADRHQAPSYPLRMPEELKKQVADAAVESGRSVHSELLFRLSASFDRNVIETGVTKAQMQLAESKTRESQVQGEALFLAYATQWLVDTVGAIPEVRERHGELLAEVKQAAQHALRFEFELNPEIRLEHYREAIEAGRELVKKWRPKMVPWPGATKSGSSKRIRPSKPKP
jgi:uncharacterized protein YyaL (SSP411 family)